MQMKSLFTALAIAILAGTSIAQECESTRNTKTGLVDLGIGIVSQPEKNLQWMKCNLGEAWVNSQCQGDAHLLDFIKASSIAKNLTDLNHSDWRLPSTDELQSLLEPSCRLPTIDLTLFPTTRSDPYWTNERYSFFAHVVSFDHGYTFSTQMKTDKYVRLVRSKK
jgi:hypothetical protein